MTTLDVSSHGNVFLGIVCIVALLFFFYLIVTSLRIGDYFTSGLMTFGALSFILLAGLCYFGPDDPTVSPSIITESAQEKYGITAATGTPDEHDSPIDPNNPMHNSWHASSLTIDGKTYENCDLTISNLRKVDSKRLVDAELKCSKVSDGERITIQPK